ncbi:MAG: glycosyltransferase [Candidatus ainarchaeum sp.]|nr:glycosyltransferase [Candidatus ainarchaeum sp.]
MPKMSVIIPTLNEAKRLPKCLASLKAQSFGDYEAVIVDSGSRDGTVEIAKELGARVVFEPRLGFAVAKNTGAKASKSEILVFTDGDATHPPFWLERIAKHFSDPEVVAVIGPVKPVEQKLVHKAMFKLTTNWIPRLAAALRFYVAQAPNEAFRRGAFEKAGGYDERLRMLEDNELPNRIKREGKVVFDPALYAFVSARRFEQEGYAAATWRFLSAYWKIYVKKQAAAENYPLYHEK